MIGREEMIKRLMKYFDGWKKRNENLWIYAGKEYTGDGYRSAYFLANEYFEKGNTVGGKFYGAGRAWYLLPEAIIVVKNAKITYEEILGGKELNEGHMLLIGIFKRYIIIHEGEYRGKIYIRNENAKIIEADEIAEDNKYIDVTDFKPLVKYSAWSENKVEKIKRKLENFLKSK